MELSVDLLQVPAHGVETHVQPVANLFVRETLCELLQDFLLPARQVQIVGGRRRGDLKGLDYLTGDFTCHGCAAFADVGDGFEDFFRVGAFQKIAAGSCAEGFEYGFGVIIHGDDDDMERREKFLQSRRAFDAGHIRQMEVHEHHVGRISRDFANGVLAAITHADARKPGRFVDETLEGAADAGVVLDEGHGNHRSWCGGRHG